MIIRRLHDFIWDERWWFPTNYSGVHYGWADLQNIPGSGIYIPEVAHLHWAFLVGVCQVALRFILIRLVWRPCGIKFGILGDGKTLVSSNGLSQEKYGQQKSDMNYKVLSKKTDWTEREIEEWLGQKKLHEREQKYYRVCWELMYYTTMATYGLVIALNNNWLQHIENIWIGWPKQHISGDVYLLYIIKCGFYWHDVILFAKDFGHWSFAMRLQLIVHHTSTITLIYLSWMVNVVRFGVIVGLIHDMPDPLNRIAKLCAYAGRKTLANYVLVINLCAFIMIRIVALSIFVCYYHLMIAADELPLLYYIVLGLLVLLVLCNLSYASRMYQMLENTHIFSYRDLSKNIDSHEYGEKCTSKEK